MDVIQVTTHTLRMSDTEIQALARIIRIGKRSKLCNLEDKLFGEKFLKAVGQAE